jgi:hypothetical protein
MGIRPRDRSGIAGKMIDKRNEDILTLSYDRQRSTCAIFSAIAAIVIACIYYVARLGFADNSAMTVLKTVSVSLFLIFFPAVFRIVCTIARLRPGESWFHSNSAICMAGVIIVSALGFWGRHLGINFMAVLALIGCGAFAVILINWISQNRIRASFIFLAGVILFSMWVAGAIYGSGYSNPLYEEALTAGRYLAKDILVSSSITSMISTYGIPSTGLDGLPYCYHHWATYWFFAGISALLAVDPLKFLQLGFPVIFVPLFLWMFLELTLVVRERFARDDEARDLTTDYVFWIVFFVATIGGIIGAVSGVRIGENAQFISITYSVGLTFTFGVLSLAATLFAKNTATKKLSLSDHCLIFLLPCLLAIVGFLKISLMYLLVAIYGYLFLRLKLWRCKGITVSLILSVIALFVVIRLTTNQGSGFSGLDPLRFFRSMGKFSFTTIFFPVYYFWLWLFVIWQLYDRRALGFKQFKQAISNKRTIEVEVVLVVCLAGILPHFLMVIPGGSGFFFIDLQQWVAVSLLLANLNGFRSRTTFLESLPQKIRDTRLPAKATYTFAFFVVACVLGVVAVNAGSAVCRMIALNLNIRCAVVTSSLHNGEPAVPSLERACAEITQSGDLFPDWHTITGNLTQLLPLLGFAQESLEKSRGYDAVRELKRLGELPLAERRATMIYIPQTNRSYWGLGPKCEAVPFIAPSITGMAMVDGMPRPDCPLRTDPLINHYAVYKWRTAAEDSFHLDEAAVCARVRAHRFSKVVIVNADANKSLPTSLVDCP